MVRKTRRKNRGNTRKIKRRKTMKRTIKRRNMSKTMRQRRTRLPMFIANIPTLFLIECCVLMTDSSRMHEWYILTGSLNANKARVRLVDDVMQPAAYTSRCNMPARWNCRMTYI